MKKFLFYLVFAIIATGLLYYFLGEQGLFGGLLGTGLLGGNSAMKKLKEQGEQLDKEAEKKKAELKEIEQEKKDLEVKDLSPEEEKEYWKDV
jgi:hypothetical protein